MLKASAVDGQPCTQRLVGDRVVEKAGAGAAALLCDGQRKKPLVAQALVILGGVAGVAVMRGRTGRKIGGHLAASALQALLLGGELKIHAWTLLG